MSLSERIVYLDSGTGAEISVSDLQKVVDSVLFETLEEANATLANADSDFRIVEIRDDQTIVMEKIK